MGSLALYPGARAGGVPTRATERIRTVERPWLKTVSNDMAQVGIYAISLPTNMSRIRHMLNDTIDTPPATSPRTCLIHRGEVSFISTPGSDHEPEQETRQGPQCLLQSLRGNEDTCQVSGNPSHVQAK